VIQEVRAWTAPRSGLSSAGDQQHEAADRRDHSNNWGQGKGFSPFRCHVDRTEINNFFSARVGEALIRKGHDPNGNENDREYCACFHLVPRFESWASSNSDAGPTLKPSDGLLSSDRRADLRANDFTGNNQFHATVLLPACGGIV